MARFELSKLRSVGLIAVVMSNDSTRRVRYMHEQVSKADCTKITGHL